MTSDVTTKIGTQSSTMRKTAYIRFDLAERLQVINYVNLIVSVVLTAYLAGWSVFQAFFPNLLTEGETAVIGFVSVMATIALMCITILEYMADRSVKARAFLQCGNRLLKTADELDFAVAEERSGSEVEKVVCRYHEILAESEWNHSGEDFDLFERKQQRKASFLKAACYARALLWYYAKRISLQLLLAGMVLVATYSVANSLIERLSY